MRMYWVEKLGWLLGNKPVTTVDNEEHFVEDREYTETEALDLIKSELGIQPLYFMNKPDGMVYDDVYIEKDAGWTKIFYSYQQKILVVLMDKSNNEMSLGLTYDGEDMSIQKREVNNIDILIRQIRRDKNNIGYCAEIEYGNAFYQITGDMEKEVLNELLDGIEFW